MKLYVVVLISWAMAIFVDYYFDLLPAYAYGFGLVSGLFANDLSRITIQFKNKRKESYYYGYKTNKKISRKRI